MPVPPQVLNCYKYIDSQQKYFINELREIVAIQNISSKLTSRSYVDSAIKWMENRLFQSGFNVELRRVGNYVPEGQTAEKKLPTVILATLGNDRRKKCMLYYCHLDVSDVQADKWQSDPFTMKEKGGKLYGRGTAKMKGPILCFLHAVDTYRALGLDLPINIKIICESMNECKSVGIAELLPNLRTSFLANVDCMLITDGQWIGPSYACILYAFRGVCYFNLTIEGLEDDLNSGEYGGVVQEPLQDLIHILNNLVDHNGGIKIPGFYKDMMQVTPEEEKIYSQLKINMKEFMRDSGVRKFLDYGDSSKTLMNVWRYPSFHLHYVKTITPCGCPVDLNIPKKAHARFSVRIVPHQTPDKVCRLICDHLNTILKQRNSPNKAKLVMQDYLKPWIEDHRHWNYEAAQTASKQVYKDPANLVREGNSYRSLLEFKQVLTKTNILLLPLVNNEANIHKEDENISLRCYIEGTKLIASYFYNLSVSK